jgi:fructokinase
VCILGTSAGEVHAEQRIPTTNPADTLTGIEKTFAKWRDELGAVSALGIASFGPVDLDERSKTYGHILKTTKAGWGNTDVGPRLAKFLGVDFAFDTDVDGAALAEGEWGAARGLKDFAYVTVGTGIGVGVIMGGSPLRGFTHPELGHIRIARATGDDWPGHCVFHGACVEGLASGPAIAARVGAPAESLPQDHPVWSTVAHALAQLLHTLVLSVAPRRVILGGGVINAQPQLLPRVRNELVRSLGGYLQSGVLVDDLVNYVVPATLGAAAGPKGALILARHALE